MANNIVSRIQEGLTNVFNCSRQAVRSFVTNVLESLDDANCVVGETVYVRDAHGAVRGMDVDRAFMFVKTGWMPGQGALQPEDVRQVLEKHWGREFVSKKLEKTRSYVFINHATADL